MNPICSASLLLEIVKGKLHPEATEYLLSHQRRDGETSVGFGLPPGSVIYNKVQGIRKTKDDLILSNLSLESLMPLLRILPISSYPTTKNSFWLGSPTAMNQASPRHMMQGKCLPPPPHHKRAPRHPLIIIFAIISVLGVFVESLIDELDLNKGALPRLLMDTTSSSFTMISGNWNSSNRARDKFGSVYLLSNSPEASASWTVQFPSQGKALLSVLPTMIFLFAVRIV